MNAPFRFATLTTASGRHTLELRLADDFRSRLRGLLLAAPLRANQGMLLTHCSSIHTCFMRQNIDVVYFDALGIVSRCVANLVPWRACRSRGGDAGAGAPGRGLHALELAAGTIARLRIMPGSCLQHPAIPASMPTAVMSHAGSRGRSNQRGSAMIEFVVVGPLITLIGLATLQYGMLFFAKNQFNHASFMAARAGSTGNGRLTAIRDAYTMALVPIYGGGTNKSELDVAYGKAAADIASKTQIEILNPTVESFADFNDPALATRLGVKGRVIPNGGQIIRSTAVIRTNSGQTLQDANLLKLRITQGYKPQVPLVGAIYTRYLQWLDNGSNRFDTGLIAAGRIPIVTHVTLQMQSDAIEESPVSRPGMGNGGSPADPGDAAPTTAPPPHCADIGCTVDQPPQAPNRPAETGTGTGTGAAADCQGSNCAVPICEG